MNTTETKDKMDELAEEARSWKEAAQEWHQTAMDKTKDAAQATDQYVRDNVWTSIALAVLAGCAIGFLMGRSRD